MLETDVVVIGGGLAGLTIGARLGRRAIVLEREDRPGGLVRTESFDGWWFDRVLHLMHFADPEAERLVRSLPLGHVLARCPPEAWIQTPNGTVRYPFQLHLAGLKPDVRDRCVRDFAAAEAGSGSAPGNYQELLLETFGRAMCEEFYFPYNRKMWRRPLEELATSGFQWNLIKPSVEAVRAGALGTDNQHNAYNSNGWYPRPAADAPSRGMEIVAQGLASLVADLRLRRTVTAIDTKAQVVHCAEESIRYRRACVSTAPLPTTVALCDDSPADLSQACSSLPSNRVRSVAIRMVGPRPEGFGLWRYYTDENLPFTRLISMTGFDPLMAPAHGWGLLAEVVERSDRSPVPASALAGRVVSGVADTGLLDRSEVVGVNIMDNDPAYAVFTPASARTAEWARDHLRSRSIVPLGRYGRWEYSSMAQVITDAIRLAERL